MLGNVSILAFRGESGKAAWELPRSVKPAYLCFRARFIITEKGWHFSSPEETSKALARAKGSLLICGESNHSEVSKNLMNAKDELDPILNSLGGRSLAWLADAPMFIDADQISALYNAVAKPEHSTGKITLSLTKTNKFDLKGKAGVEGELGVAAW